MKKPYDRPRVKALVRVTLSDSLRIPGKATQHLPSTYQTDGLMGSEIQSFYPIRSPGG